MSCILSNLTSSLDSILVSFLDYDGDASRSFEQFFLHSILPNNISNNAIKHIGTKYLEPFTFRAIDVIDEYSLSSDIAQPSDLFSSNCFPRGIKIHLIPRCAAEGARRLGWIGEHADSYQVHSLSLFNSFTQQTEEPLHGISIT